MHRDFRALGASSGAKFSGVRDCQEKGGFGVTEQRIVGQVTPCTLSWLRKWR